MNMPYADFHRRSIDDRDAFWAEQASAFHWFAPHTQVLDWQPPHAEHMNGRQVDVRTRDMTAAEQAICARSSASGISVTLVSAISIGPVLPMTSAASSTQRC